MQGLQTQRDDTVDVCARAWTAEDGHTADDYDYDSDKGGGSEGHAWEGGLGKATTGRECTAETETHEDDILSLLNSSVSSHQKALVNFVVRSQRFSYLLFLNSIYFQRCTCHGCTCLCVCI